ncbi:hypothetical protein MishRS11D_44360 (plasmid) [Methylomagnum ishizawai]|nr:hypothetical protein MishRS11D_44360 [Methylomagnum ishizawai]
MCPGAWAGRNGYYATRIPRLDSIQADPGIPGCSRIEPMPDTAVFGDLPQRGRAAFPNDRPPKDPGQRMAAR